MNAPLSISIKSDTLVCHFVYTGYTYNSQEYSVVKLLYAGDCCKTNKTYSGFKKKIHRIQHLGEDDGSLLGGINGDILNPDCYSKWTC